MSVVTAGPPELIAGATAARRFAGSSLLRFRVEVRGQLIEVDMTLAETSYRLLEGSGVVVHHAGEELRLRPLAVHRRPAFPAVGALPRFA